MPGKIQCACGKQYTWKPELAGKRAKCKACGSVVSFPASDPDDAAPTVIAPRSAPGAQPARSAAAARPAASARSASSTAASATLKAPLRPATKAPANIPPPPPPPAREEIPEGFEDMYQPGMDVPPPPPPPPVSSSFAGSAGHTPPVAIKGAKSIGGSDSSGGFKWSWGAALNVLIGLGLIGFAVMEYFLISDAEAQGVAPKFGRRSGLTRLIYGVAGKWGVAIAFSLIGLAMIVGGILVMMGKTKPAESDD